MTGMSSVEQLLTSDPLVRGDAHFDQPNCSLRSTPPIYHVPSKRILDAKILQRTEGRVTLSILQERIILESGPVMLYTPLYRTGAIEEAMYVQKIGHTTERYTPYRDYNHLLHMMVPVFSHNLEAILSYAREQAHLLAEFMTEPTLRRPAISAVESSAHNRLKTASTLASSLIIGICSLDTLDEALVPEAFREVLRYVRTIAPLARKIYQHMLATQEFAEEANGPAAIVTALMEPQDLDLGEGLDVVSLRAGLEAILPTIQAWRLLS